MSVEQVYAAPGNPGIGEVGKCIEINPTDITGLAKFAADHNIDLTVVGPEQPLALGIVDAFREKDLRIFGPNTDAAQVETSKTYAKQVCLKNRIPSPRWNVYGDSKDAIAALDEYGPPWVVKADGLAAGKGTTVTRDKKEAVDAVRREIKRSPGQVILEEFIEGWEATFMATISGGRIQWLTPVFQDYKPAYDDDTGPNTGGMGCFSPVPEVSDSLIRRVRESILEPMINGLRRDGVNYQGILNLNAIVKRETGEPMVLEFNARFGDPECQGVMSLVDGGLANHISQVADNIHSTKSPDCKPSTACVVVVVASKGYPTGQEIGDKITLRPVIKPNVRLFHAGTSRDRTGGLVTAGGRVLNIAATGPNLESARNNAYATIRQAVHFEGMQYRTDIGLPSRPGRRLQQEQLTRTL